MFCDLLHGGFLKRSQVEGHPLPASLQLTQCPHCLLPPRPQRFGRGCICLGHELQVHVGDWKVFIWQRPLGPWEGLVEMIIWLQVERQEWW